MEKSNKANNLKEKTKKKDQRGGWQTAGNEKMEIKCKVQAKKAEAKQDSIKKKKP